MDIFREIVRAVDDFNYEIRTRVIVNGVVVQDNTDLVNCSSTKMRSQDGLSKTFNGATVSSMKYYVELTKVLKEE